MHRFSAQSQVNNADTTISALITVLFRFICISKLFFWYQYCKNGGHQSFTYSYNLENFTSCLRNVVSVFHIVQKERAWRRRMGLDQGFEMLDSRKPLGKMTDHGLHKYGCFDVKRKRELC